MKEELNFEEIGERIRAERVNLKLSREGLSELVGISSYFLGQIERAERKMSIDTLINISKCLHVSIDDLIFNRAKYNNDNNLQRLVSECSEKELKVCEDIIKILVSHFAQ